VIDSEIKARLAAPPQAPAHPEYFTADTPGGEPGIYPEGPPMVPAASPPISAVAARAELTSLLALLGAPDRDAVLDAFDDQALIALAPDGGVRAGTALLAATIGAPILSLLRSATRPISSLRYGDPGGTARIAGPLATGFSARVVNARYQGEHFLLLPGAVAHEVLHHDPTVSNAEEVTLHALLAMIHCQVIARWPFVARLGTELSRRMNSFAITWLNSREPGADRITLIAPDGPGTIPGGAPKMQTPDFWSVPFIGGPPVEVAAPPTLRVVFERVVEPGTSFPNPLRYDRALAATVDAHLDDAWLPPADRLAVLEALSLL
jgi:hypothetical protein